MKLMDKSIDLRNFLERIKKPKLEIEFRLLESLHSELSAFCSREGLLF